MEHFIVPSWMHFLTAFLTDLIKSECQLIDSHTPSFPHTLIPHSPSYTPSFPYTLIHHTPSSPHTLIPTHPHSPHTLIHHTPSFPYTLIPTHPNSPHTLCSLCAVGFVHITNRSPYLPGWLLTWRRRPGCTPHIQVSIPVHHVLSHAGLVIAMFRLILDSDEVITKLHYGLKWIQGEVKKNQNIRGKFEVR